MKKYLVIYYATPEAFARMASFSPEQQAEDMKSWFAWKEKLGDKVVDLGAPLFGGTRVLADGSTEMSTKGVAGYSIIQANDLAEAITFFKNHPHYNYDKGCEIEVHELESM